MVFDSDHTIYIYFMSQFPLQDQTCTDLLAEKKTIKSEKYILLAVNTEASLVSPKYHVASQLTIPQPEKSYVYSTIFWCRPNTPRPQPHESTPHTNIIFNLQPL
jgi:hypothetical protein